MNISSSQKHPSGISASPFRPFPSAHPEQSNGNPRDKFDPGSTFGAQESGKGRFGLMAGAVAGGLLGARLAFDLVNGGTHSTYHLAATAGVAGGLGLGVAQARHAASITDDVVGPAIGSGLAAIAGGAAGGGALALGAWALEPFIGTDMSQTAFIVTSGVLGAAGGAFAFQAV